MPRAAVATSFARESTAKSTTDDQMSTISVHSFGESETESESFTIRIIENIREDYGMFVWPCAVVLAEYVWQQRDRFRCGVNVLEIGAGTALPGLVAARVGADVTLSDDSDKLEVLENIRRVCDLNKLDCQNSPGSVFITTYHHRSGHHLIEFLLVKWGLKCVKLVDVFSFMPSDKASKLGGNIQLAEIALCHDEEN